MHGVTQFAMITFSFCVICRERKTTTPGADETARTPIVGPYNAPRNTGNTRSPEGLARSETRQRHVWHVLDVTPYTS